MGLVFASLSSSTAAPKLGHEARPCTGLLREEVDELSTVLDSDAGDVETRNRSDAALSAVVGENEGTGCPYEKRSPPGPGPGIPEISLRGALVHRRARPIAVVISLTRRAT